MYLINTEQREHLKLLRENSPDVAIEICKLTLDYMNNGLNNSNRFQAIATKINTSTSALQDAINALIMLQLNSIKTKVSEEDFALIAQTGFSKEHISILWQFITSKRDFVLNVLDQISLVEYRFRDLEWRLEGRISSRSLMHQSIPFITIKFHLDSEKVNENKSPLDMIGESASEPLTGDSQQHSRKKVVIFQTDPNNLLYIINVLEKTLQEARTHRVRNIVKNL
ncbi:COMM domain-containing protein 2 [Sitodiplosis mosellana]|uniref:COMM domain-containing protein 2 n=1 Tax=Sitodiplosis mosellana TaxID=263140 RepID=UPI002444DBBE|nr:COMM domain-containing protein 2 [Sitodiplosis mosellana]